MEEAMNRKLIPIAVGSALAACASLAFAEERVYRIDDESHVIRRAPEWNLAANEGMCRLRIWVDDTARVKLQGDRITVETDSGKRAFDQGSVCTQPLPAHPVYNFHVEVAHGRGTVMEVREPDRRNDYTGTVRVVDPQNGGDSYELIMAWNTAGPVVGVAPAPVPAPVPGYVAFDATRACQERVRDEFVSRNRDGDAYVEFGAPPAIDQIGRERSTIHGNAWARSRDESRPIAYDCTLNDRTQRVLWASYDMRDNPRVSSLR
jgi:hypothetical protein